MIKVDVKNRQGEKVEEVEINADEYVGKITTRLCLDEATWRSRRLNP